ncbi:probable secreted glycoprotein [Natronomonas moolapensis 8.8.11]|uniref:Probable secreted glycoprotein n=1 Tax=Natronomonas moolapensis (strain DSM 18674 / CECT 7526 / JCM 14361 / 8.8.11) TaxID=268739 RepID=M1Y1R8_NATM8|nr:hypothetical protein [Natronomonas moolapensis]CCQ36417.1 probable secreted glycoprotein [Natronomonas moolapensis 8.8.11]
MRSDDRGVSVAVGYVLGLGIATLLFSVLLIGGSGMIENQTQTVTYDQLSVTGQQLAADLSGVDRLVRAGGGGDGAGLSEVSLRTDLPNSVAAGGYTIEITYTEADDTGTIELRSSSPDVVVSVPFRSVTPVRGTTIGGGTVETHYDGSEDELVVESV